MKRIGLFISVLAKLTLCVFLLGQFGGCMTSLSYNERMNTRFPAENFFFNERAEMGQAIYKNDIGKVKQLIAQGHNVNAQPANHQGFTYLMYAVFLKERFEITKLLLEAGAEPNQLSIVDFPRYQSPYIVQANTESTIFYLPLYLAASNRNIDYMKILLEHGANPNLDKNLSGGGWAGPALFSAVATPYSESGWSYERRIEEAKKRIELLLQYGADLSQPNQLGQNIIIAADNYPEIVLYLMDKGIDPKLYGKKLVHDMKVDLGYTQEIKDKIDIIIQRLAKLGYH